MADQPMNSIVRQNMMNDKNYTPYCGNDIARHLPNGCDNPRTFFNGSQMKCPHCSWISTFPRDFIDSYKEKHGLNQH